MTQKTLYIVLFGMLNTHDQTVLGVFESEEDAHACGKKTLIEGGYGGNPNFRYEVIPQQLTVSQKAEE
jgi:hypothetical protein